MRNVSFKMNKEEVKASLADLQKKAKRPVCWKCGEEIIFRPDNQGKWYPHNLDKTPHWDSCSYSTFVQKKMSVNIMAKLAYIMIGKYKIDISTDCNLSKKELQVIHFCLEKELSQPDTFIPEISGKVNDEIPFRPEPCDSIGDPDEERAPSEDLVQKVQDEFHQEHDLDKFGVTQAITEMITQEVKDGSDIRQDVLPTV